MGKKKKDTMELRFYEVPQNEYVLALLGDSWIRDYGHDESNLHFHNLMEIGYCKHGTGELILNEESKPYEPAMVSIIPFNFDSSGTLKTQIQEGADCDLFLSAGQKQMNQLDITASADVNTDGLDFVDPSTRVDLLENKVVLCVPEGSDKGIDSFDALAD